jgi:serine/threonine protein kinase
MSMEGPPASGSMPQLESPSLVGQVLDGRYRLTKKLGEGGMGEVYAADHVHIEKKFAVKLLRPEIVSNREAVTRFRQEARSSSSIGHRNIIAIEDFGDLPDGRIYMCMELLNGAPLNDMIRAPMPVDRLLNILIQTGHGLAAAHAKGIIHRDMKPENIFVTIGPNGEDIPKLLDFGIAKVSGNDGQNNLTRTGTIFGTPFYMAPEQALGNPVDARTDIYAVGVIMYEVFSGSLPFQGESFMGILTQHITTEPEPIAQRAAKAGRQLPAGLAEIITRCMMKNPAQRYQTMDELVNSLVQIYRGMVGPGMSAYMEAFPVSSMHPIPTPGPMTGPVRTSQTSPPMGPGSGPQQSPSGPYHPATGPHAMPYADSAPIQQPKKSKTGLIIAIIAILAVGGGVAAFLIVSNNGGDDPNKNGSNGSNGSNVVHNDHPDAAVATAKDASIVTNPADATVVASTADATVEEPKDAGVVAPPDAAIATPSTIPVLLMAKNGVAFEVYESGKKVLDGPDNLDVTPGSPRTIVIKSKGFKDKTVTVDVKDGLAMCTGAGCVGDKKKKKVTFALDRASVIIHNGSNGSGEHTVPPPRIDCREALRDPRDKECRAQYCARHEDDVRCGLE